MRAALKSWMLLMCCMLAMSKMSAQQPICGKEFLTKYVNYQLSETGYRNLEVNGIRYYDKGYWVSGFIEKIATANRDFFLAKLNDTGGVVFAKVLGDVPQEGGYCSALPVSDGCIISGRSKGTKDVAIISKITDAGNIAWTKSTESVSGNYDAIRGVHMDEAKNQIVAVGTGTQQTGKANVMILSLDDNGNTLWTRNIDLGGAQHHLNAIRKIDSIYYIAGWAQFSGVWKPTLIFVSETGRIIQGQYADVTGNSIYVDMEVDPSGKLFLLGFSLVSGQQYGFLTCMSKNGTVLWRKYLGYGNSDFGDNLFYDNGDLWVFGQTIVSGVGKREFFVKYDTLGAVKDRGRLYEAPYAFSAKINGWPVGRSHFGGVAVVGVDNKTANTTHFEIMFTNPCDQSSCSVNADVDLISRDYSVVEKNVNLPSTNSTNGGLLDMSISAVGLNVSEKLSCYRICSFSATRKVPSSLKICNNGTDKVLVDATANDCRYLWENGDTAASRAIAKAGTYWVKTYNNCGARVDTIVVLGVDQPLKTMLADSLYCYGGWTYLASLTSMPETTIAWENGDASWSRSIGQPGKYWYEISNRCGVWRDTFVITQDVAPKSVLPADLNPCNGNYVLLDGTQKGSGKYQYQWEDGYAGASLWVTVSSTKILRTWNQCGTIIDTVNVTFGECNCRFWVPTAFTPRASEGRNDVWKPAFNCAADATFSIYSRWGECLVRDQSIDVPWDGTYLGKLVPEGLYVYIISGNYSDAVKGLQRIDKSGTLLLIDGGK